MTVLPTFNCPPVLAAGEIPYAFYNSDLLGQGICIGLLVLSILVWAYMVWKGMLLCSLQKEAVAFQQAFREKRNPLGLKEKCLHEKSTAACIYAAACKRIENFHIQNPSGGRRALNNDELEMVRSVMDQEVEEQILVLEKGMTYLSIAVSGSPFLGLFGTVWGITLAFTNLAMAGRADIQTLAPGVSGALLTTVIALIVAIPSMVGYNLITNKIKEMTVQMDNFADEVHTRFKIEQLETLNSLAQSSSNPQV